MNNKKIFNSKSDIFYFILAIILIIFSIYVSIKAGEFVVKGIKYVFDNYPTISVALITGLLAFVSVPVGKYFENKYTIKSKIRQEKQIVYIEFLDWLIKNVLNNEISKNKNFVKELKEQQNKIVIYGSDKVLRAWLEFKTVSMETTEKVGSMEKTAATKIIIEKQALFIEKLILEIRKELGYKNKNIKEYDLLRLYINDINNYI